MSPCSPAWRMSERLFEAAKANWIRLGIVRSSILQRTAATSDFPRIEWWNLRIRNSDSVLIQNSKQAMPVALLSIRFTLNECVTGSDVSGFQLRCMTDDRPNSTLAWKILSAWLVRNYSSSSLKKCCFQSRKFKALPEYRPAPRIQIFLNKSRSFKEREKRRESEIIKLGLCKSESAEGMRFGW